MGLTVSLKIDNGQQSARRSSNKRLYSDVKRPSHAGAIRTAYICLQAENKSNSAPPHLTVTAAGTTGFREAQPETITALTRRTARRDHSAPSGSPAKVERLKYGAFLADHLTAPLEAAVTVFGDINLTSIIPTAAA